MEISAETYFEVSSDLFEEFISDIIDRTVEERELCFSEEKHSTFMESQLGQIIFEDRSTIRLSEHLFRFGCGKIQHAVSRKIHLFITWEELGSFNNFLNLHMKESMRFELDMQKILTPPNNYLLPLRYLAPDVFSLKDFSLSEDQKRILKIVRFNETVRAFIYKYYLWSKHHDIWIEWEHFRKMDFIIHRRTRERVIRRLCFEIKISCDYSIMLEDICIDMDYDRAPHLNNLLIFDSC